MSKSLKVFNDVLFLCPVCNGKAELHYHVTNLREFPTRYYVICTECGLRTQDYDTTSNAVKFWNMRDGQIKPDDNWDD